MPLKKELLDILVCPKCKKDLEYKEKEDKLLCHHCRLAYDVVENVPVMLLDDAKPF